MQERVTLAPYETLFVVHPELGGRVKEFNDKFKSIVEGQGGSVSHVEEWGLKDLAYKVQKQSKGYYVLLRYRSGGRAVEELERNMKLTDGLLRYLTVRLDEAASQQQQAETAGKRTEEDSAKQSP